MSIPAVRDERRLAGVVEPVWSLAGHGYGQHDGVFGMSTVTQQDPSAIIISSEHLTETPEHWQPVPFQHVVFFQQSGETCSVQVSRLEL